MARIRNFTRMARNIQPFIAQQAANVTSIVTADLDLGATLSSYMMIPGLRGLWTFASVSEDSFIDMSGQGRHLSAAGTAAYSSNDLISYYDAEGTNSYLFRADEAGLDIIANLSFGGWFRFDALPTNKNFYGKLGAAGQYGYVIQLDATSFPKVYVSSNGILLTSMTATVASVISTWYFMAAVYTPSTSLVLWINDTKYTNTTSIPAAIFNCSAQFQIGANSYASQFMNGRAAMCWVSCASLSDAQITQLYERSKNHF